MDKKVRLIVLVVTIVAVIGLAVWGVIGSGSRQTPQNQTTGNGGPTTLPTSEDVTENENAPNLTNIEILSGPFSIDEAAVINNSVLDFAYNSLGKYRNLKIDPVSLTKRSANEYGFTVLDENDSQLFYVVATRKDGGKIDVMEYLR